LRRTTAIGTALLAAAWMTGLGAACGDDGPKEVTKADYLAQAKAVCQEGQAALSAASNAKLAKVPAGQKLAQPEVEEFVRTTVVPTIRDQVKRLRALPPPKGEQAHLDEIYTALEQSIAELEQSPAKLRDGSNVFAAADALAQKYGISVCATTG
jgi:hypothetical protein